MQGTIERLAACGRQLTLYLPPAGGRLPTAYLNDGEMAEGMLEELAAYLEKELAAGRCRPFLLVAIPSPRRDAEYTPWPAPAAFGSGPDYAGQAAGYLKLLEKEIKPLVDSRYPTLPGPVETALCGYSLGGLCALYAAYGGRAFGRIASVSGSLWYPGWKDFVEANPPAHPLAALWLSLGKKEAKARPPFSIGKEAALASAGQLSSFAQRSTFVWHEGGHFHNIPGRIAEALCWLFQREDGALGEGQKEEKRDEP